MSKSVLEQLQDDVADRLRSLVFLADVPVFVLREEHIDSQIEQALTTIKAGGTGKSGAAITVMMPLLDVPKDKVNIPGPLTKVSISVRAQEFPTINMGANGTGLSAETLGIEIVQALHHFSIESIGTLLAHSEALTPSRDFLPRITYIATLQAWLSMTPLTKPTRPTIQEAGGIVTLGCATPGVDIYFALDSTGLTPALPRPGAGTLYAISFGLTPGLTTKLRVAAYKAGNPVSWVGSDVAEATIIT